jgi:hypothetical protein
VWRKPTSQAHPARLPSSRVVGERKNMKKLISVVRVANTTQYVMDDAGRLTTDISKAQRFHSLTNAIQREQCYNLRCPGKFRAECVVAS